MSIANLSHLPVAYGTFVGNGTTAVVVPAPEAKLTSIILFSVNTLAGTAPTTAPFISALTAGTGFSVKAGTAGDTSTYNWVMYNLQ